MESALALVATEDRAAMEGQAEMVALQVEAVPADLEVPLEAEAEAAAKVPVVGGLDVTVQSPLLGEPMTGAGLYIGSPESPRGHFLCVSGEDRAALKTGAWQSQRNPSAERARYGAQRGQLRYR